MNDIIRSDRKPRRIGARALGVIAAAALAAGTIGVAAPAFADDHHWHGHRAYHGHWHGGGYVYAAPPVVYGGYAPGYYYGPDYYAPPPVVYGAPGVGVGVNLPGVSIGVGIP